ncbi:MAG: hypothetical protein ACE5NJ_04780, partial [Thermodesulfobacteriota bacterium]
MYKWIVIICVTISMLFGIAISAEPEQEEFISEYVAAINARDILKLKRLVHPECLACITDQNHDYYEDYFSREIEEEIPGNYKISNIKPIGKDEPLLMSEAFSYPVRPTHWVQIDFQRGPYDFASVLRQIVKLNEAWFLVVPCPTPNTVKQFREAKVAGKKQKERAKALFKKLRDPLLSELKELLKEGKKIQAWKRYSSETKESLSMAKEVLLLLNEFTAEKKVAKSLLQEYKAEIAFPEIGKSYAKLEDLK